jgi:hypothetical protein
MIDFTMSVGEGRHGDSLPYVVMFLKSINLIGRCVIALIGSLSTGTSAQTALFDLKDMQRLCVF